MVENDHPQPPAPAPPPPAVQPPLGVARGPAYPPAEQLLQLNYCIHSNPSWAQTAILGFQHYIVMLGSIVMITSILVPRMGGDPGDKARVIQAVLFMSGLNTLLQALFGTRLPTVMGPSFAYILAILSIINDFRDEDFSSEHERFLHTMRAIQGSLIISSFINMLLGFSQAWGEFTKLLSPLIVVPYVCVVGLGLFGRGFPQLATCVEIGLPMLVFLVVLQQYMKRLHPAAHPILERFALLVCIALIWAFAAILTAAGAYNNVGDATKRSCRTDRSYLMSSAPWIKIPYPFQWGTPIFRASHVFGMMGAALVTTVESTGTFIAASRFAGATPPPAHVLSRSIGLQGVGQLLDGIFGSIAGTNASVENVGLLALTHVGSRRVVQISTIFMFFFSIFAAVGVTFIQFTNNNSMRNIYIMGLSLFLGISIPQYFVANTNGNTGHGPVHSGGGWFDDALNTIFASAPMVALIVGMILDNTLDPHHARDERGVPWWDPFQHKKGDSRNEEFYSFPLRINEYVPTRFL
ncbi:nucleobase-ascorbate transporter 3-like isoform X2 [Bidens hawaiensis]|uniref:nucleobase-ascorbate transporter 3-like isoform X2 n=1 Tax=Bidens hawaiensis TaxID=980011 RepID=UPI00404A0228